MGIKEISGNKEERVQNRNLIPARKGEVRNPRGRGKGNVSIWTRIKKKLREKVKEGPHAGKRYADLAADAYVKACLQGDFRHLKELLDRDDGPVPIDFTGTVDVRSYTTDELRIIRDILAASERRAGRPVLGSN